VPLSGGTNPPVLYLISPNKGYLVSTDVAAESGFFEPQVAGPFSNASISGPYAFGTVDPTLAGVNHSIGVTIADGVGNFFITQDQGSPGALISDIFTTDTYSVAANGRAQLSDGSILYLVSPSKAVVIEAKPGKTKDVVIVADGQTAAGASADLALSVSPTAPQVATGAQVTFDFTVTNNGPSSATNVVFSNTLPGNLTFVGAFPSQGTCSGTSAISCQLGSIGNGNSLLIQITATANAVGTGTETGFVAATETDP